MAVRRAPTLATSCAALPPSFTVYGALPCSGRPVAAAKAPPLARQRGFTLLELLVVISIIGIGTAGVALAMRDGNQAQLEREAQRLTALLESARAQSRSSGAPVQWVGSTKGFWFEGVAPGSLPDNWLAPTTTVTTPQRVGLGPEPLIGKQSITLVSSTAPGRSVTVSTDGLRPFKVQADDAVTP